MACTRLTPPARCIIGVSCLPGLVWTGLSSEALPRGAVVLDQQEIGTYEAAYDPHEELAVDNEYEAAMPFRDPGHISRSEIRLAHALQRSGTTKRDETWDFIKPLWSKYIQAMRDPTDVQIGWTNPRHLSKGADYLQTAVERHAYGAEGHREPERGFDVGEPSTGPGFEWARDLRNGLGTEKPTEGYHAGMPHMMHEHQHMEGYRGRDAHGGDARRHVKKPSKLETQVQDLHKMLRSETNDMHELSAEVKELSAENRAAKDDTLRQQLTYKVLKDKLVHSRLKKKIEEEKEKKEERGGELETAEVRKMLAEQTAQMKGMQQKLTALAAAKASAAKHHRSRLSAKAAQKDLSSYFSQLDRQEAKEEVSEAKAKLVKLTGLLGVKQAAAHTQTAATQTARKTHRGSLLEATSLFGKDSDEEAGLTEHKSARQEKKAHVEQLAIVDDNKSSSKGSSLDSLVRQLKSETTNEAPFLPL